MKKEELALYRNRYHCGDIVVTDNPAEAGKELTKAQIYRIYPHFAIVTNGRYRWCVHWVDLKKNNP